MIWTILPVLILPPCPGNFIDKVAHPATLAGVLRTANWRYTVPSQTGGGNEPYAVAGRSTKAISYKEHPSWPLPPPAGGRSAQANTGQEPVENLSWKSPKMTTRMLLGLMQDVRVQVKVVDDVAG